MGDVIFYKSIPGLSAEEIRPEKNFSMANRHLHDSIEILYMMEGERYFFIEQNIYYVKKGMAVMINHNQLHRGSIVDDSTKYHRFVLYIDTSMFDKYFSLPQIPAVRNFGEKYWGVAEFDQDDWLQSLTILEAMKKEMNRNTSDGNALSLLLVMQLITLFARNRKNPDTALLQKQMPDKKNIPGVHQLVHEIALYLQNHSNETCSLDDIAARFYISRSYLTRIFKSVTGFTVSEYLMTCRVQKAKILLDKTDLDITEISIRTGFGNVSYFDKIFKRIADMTPLQYRKREKI